MAEVGAQAPGGPVLVPPRWAPMTSFVICILAVADSAYLTYSHYFNGGKVTGCQIGKFINCDAVTNSSYSRVLGIPVALYGLVWAVGMLVLCSPPAWKLPSPWVGRLRLLGSVAGVVSILWLVYAELFKIRAICEFCTGVHVLTLALFVVLVFATALALPAEPGPEVDDASAMAAVAPGRPAPAPRRKATAATRG